MKVVKKHISLVVTRICTILVMLDCVQTYANYYGKMGEVTKTVRTVMASVADIRTYVKQ